MKEFSFPIRVYYEDTDFAQVVYHANYLKFMERARTEWLRDMGFDQQKMLEEDSVFAVTDLQISYLKSAHFNDQLLVKSRIINCSFVQVTFEQEIYLQDNLENPLSKAVVKVASLRFSTMKPLKLSKTIREEFLRVI